MNVDGSDVDLQDIIPTDGGAKTEEGSLDGAFEMRWFDSGKYSYAVYCDPLYADEEGETELDYAGWGDLDYLMPVTKTFAPGQWFLIKPTGVETPQLQVAGSLVTSDATKPAYSIALTPNKLQSAGNPFPMSCDIQAIVPMDGNKASEEGSLDGAFEMRWFDGGKYSYAVFCDPLYADEEGETELDYAGWGDLEFLMPITKVFGMGEGFLIKPTAVTEPKLAFPNPLYTK